LVSKDVIIGDRVFNEGQQWVIIDHFGVPVSEHLLIEEVLGTLDVVLVLLLQVKSVCIRVNTDLHVLSIHSLHCIHSQLIKLQKDLRLTLTWLELIASSSILKVSLTLSSAAK